MVELEKTFEEAGLKDIQALRPKARPSTRQPNMMNWMLAMTESGLALERHPTLGHHAKSLLEQREKAVNEARELGVGMDLALVRCCGRKAGW